MSNAIPAWLIQAKTATPSLLARSIAIAAHVHAGQVDRGGQPYILHPLRIMLKMEREEEMIVAVLHDVVEDSVIGLRDLRAAGFPDAVINAIECLTRQSGEEYENFILRARGNRLARHVKLADLEDNMNLARIPNPGPEDLARVEKYRRAVQVLCEEQQQPEVDPGHGS